MSNTTDYPIRYVNSESIVKVDQVVEQARLASADKLLAVVELLMRSREALSARTIAESVGINRSTTHRALNTLIHRGWVERRLDAADYRLSVKFLALLHVASQTRSFLEEIRPKLEELSVTSRETVHVGVLDETDVLHVDKIDSPERFGVSSKIGTRGPAHSASLGKALLAASPDDVVEEYIVQAKRLTAEDRLHDANKLREEIRLTRERGYSIDNEEDAVGVRCLGVAVRGAGGVPLFAVSLTGPAPRFTMERVTACVPVMLNLSRELSAELGWESSHFNGGNNDFGTMQRIE
jgi:IclR family KDG regulon transcriptional repressor